MTTHLLMTLAGAYQGDRVLSHEGCRHDGVNFRARSDARLFKFCSERRNQILVDGNHGLQLFSQVSKLEATLSRSVQSS